jgi:hypothetical protein
MSDGSDHLVLVPTQAPGAAMVDDLRCRAVAERQDVTAACASVVTTPKGSGQVIRLTRAAAWRIRGRRMASGCSADAGSTGPSSGRTCWSK